jgi:hypothetical protein
MKRQLSPVLNSQSLWIKKPKLFMRNIKKNHGPRSCQKPSEERSALIIEPHQWNKTLTKSGNNKTLIDLRNQFRRNKRQTLLALKISKSQQLLNQSLRLSDYLQVNKKNQNVFRKSIICIK